MVQLASGSQPITERFNCTDFRVNVYEAMIRDELELEASTVFATVFAPPDDSGNAPEYVVCGAASGWISVFKVDGLSSGTDPAVRFHAHTGACYSLACSGTGAGARLISAGDDGRTVLWAWQDVAAAAAGEGAKPPRPVLELTAPQPSGRRGVKGPIPEVNSAVASPDGRHIYTGCGDGICHVWDVGAGAGAPPVVSLAGHGDMIHSVALRPRAGQVATASEDGTVRLWDARSGKCCQAIDAWRGVAVPTSSRAGGGGVGGGAGGSEQAYWLSSVAVDQEENWLAVGCGGGRSLMLWSVVGDACTARIPLPAPPQAVVIHKDSVVTAGAEPRITSLGIGGEDRGRIPTTSPSCFALAVDGSQSGMRAVGGAGGWVDVISGLGSQLGTVRVR